MEDKKEIRIDVIIGKRGQRTVLLIAPQWSAIVVGDSVRTTEGEYSVMFVEPFKRIDDPMVVALIVALGMEPMKVINHIKTEAVNWGDYDDADLDG
jgi:hypothetical protein